MRQRKFLIAANWKMYPPPGGWNAEGSPYRPREDIDVYTFPSSPFLHFCSGEGLNVGAQAARPEPSGAFTGDISMSMLPGLGCTAVLCGHSDRRQKHGETDAFIAAQAEAAVGLYLLPIVCIGETAEERAAGSSKDVVKQQLAPLLPLMNAHEIVLAYEPVWAISGGDSSKQAATAQDAEDMHAFIRSLLPTEKKETTRILYGGSMKPANAKELLSQPNIDGGLVGNASLKPEEFKQILDAAVELS